MFYVKEKLSDAAEINIKIDYDNVYTRCPACGKEFKFYIQEFISDGDFDLEETSFYCDECAKNMR